MVERVVYTSASTERFTRGDLEQLLRVSRRNNAGAGLTGLLLHCEGHFLQVLEGERADVRAVLARIALDPRHTGVWTVLEERDAERRFADWSMGFIGISGEEIAALPGFNPRIMDPGQRDVGWLDPTQVEVLIDRFRDRAQNAA